MSWRVRFEGSETVVELPTAQKVLEGGREGEWEASDDVRGPIDRDWTPIEEHAQFADAIAELEPHAVEGPDETRLDMNPLIDVALVLIFFILTTTYSILRRTIDVPGEPETKDEGKKAKLTPQQLEERMFKVELWMIEGHGARLKINDKIIELNEVAKALQDAVKATGHREMLLEFEGRVPWGIVAQVIDAAKAAEIQNVNLKRKKPG